MKTKHMFAVAIIAALNGAGVNAQVLGGNAMGGLGGSLGAGLGGTRDIGVMGQGAGHGSFGGDLDTTSLRRTTRDVAGRTTNGAHNVVTRSTERARSSVATARDVGANTVAGTRERVADTTTTARAVAGVGAQSAMNTTHGLAANASHLDASAAGDAAGDAPVMQLATLATDTNDAPVAQESAPASLPLQVDGDANASGHATASKEQGVSASGSGDGRVNASVTK